MTVTEVIRPEVIESGEREVADVVARARGLAITDEASMNAAGEFLRLDVKAMLKKADEWFDPAIKAAHLAHKENVALKAKFTAPLLAAETVLKRAIGEYHTRVMEAQAAEQRRLEAEARKAAELEKAGQQEAAEAALAAPVVVQAPRPIAPPPPAAPKGISVRKVWKYRITNPRAIKPDFMCPNEGAIAAIVKSQGAGAVAIVGAGIEVYEDSVVGSRAV